MQRTASLKLENILERASRSAAAVTRFAEIFEGMQEVSNTPPALRGTDSI